MKKCNTCGATMADDSRFCPACGSSDIVPLPEGPAEQPPVNAPAPPQQTGRPAGGAPSPAGGAQRDDRPAQPAGNTSAGGAAPQQSGVYPYASGTGFYPAAQPEKNKSKIGIIIAVLLGVVILIFAFFAVIGLMAQNEAKKIAEENAVDPMEFLSGLVSEYYSDAEESTLDEELSELFSEFFTDPEDTAPAVPYTKGTLTGDGYVNEWAGLRFGIPEGFANGGDGDYAAYADDRTDVAFVASSDGGEKEFVLLIEDVSDTPDGMTETEYLKTLTEDWVNEEDASVGWALSKPYSLTIAGQNYRAVKKSSGRTDQIELAACRCYDRHVICFICRAEKDTVEAFLAGAEKP